MTRNLKFHTCQKILDRLVGNNQASLPTLISKTQFDVSKSGVSELHIPLKALAYCTQSKEQEIRKSVKDLLSDHLIQDVTLSEVKGLGVIKLSLHRNGIIKSVLEDETAPQASIGKRIVFEFSSPNIAKPFHVGHLRSTIIGNFLCNLHAWCGYDVIRLNYLGDWGTQFGMIKVGLDILNVSEEELSQQPLSTLYNAYVCANKAAVINPEISEKARKIFADTEVGSKKYIDQWNTYRKYTVKSLQETYDRLGISFHEYAWESTYNASNISGVIDALRSKNLVRNDDEGRLVADCGDGRVVPLLKSDGTTLYIARDIAAAMDRQTRYKFDQMFYIVDHSQKKHFENLTEILENLGQPWARQIKHISFGRVRGMSTRRGEVVFLADILDQAKEVMLENMRFSKNTKVDIDDQATADILGVSAVIAADLRHSRTSDYTFDWKNFVSAKGETGVRLQYSHSRLCSLHDECGLTAAINCNPDLLPEDEAIKLVQVIASFDDILQTSLEDMNASVLSVYLYKLCSSINTAMKVLRVKDMGEIGSQRLLMFEKSRQVLYRGMSILGLNPLKKM